VLIDGVREASNSLGRPFGVRVFAVASISESAALRLAELEEPLDASRDLIS
jgi:hypothetical protein